MKTTIVSLSAAMILSGALVGCAGNNNAANTPNNNGARPIGYHSGNGMLNNGTGNNGVTNGMNNGLGYNNRTGYNHNNVNNNRNRGMTAQNTNNATNTHSQEAQTIADKVANMKNVENASVVVTDNDVLVGLKTNDNGVTKNHNTQIRKTVQNVVKGKDIHVTRDPKMYSRINNVSNNLRNGTINGTNEVSSDVRGIIKDLGNAVKRPFENNAH